MVREAGYSIKVRKKPTQIFKEGAGGGNFKLSIYAKERGRGLPIRLVREQNLNQKSIYIK